MPDALVMMKSARQANAEAAWKASSMSVMGRCRARRASGVPTGGDLNDTQQVLNERSAPAPEKVSAIREGGQSR